MGTALLGEVTKFGEMDIAVLCPGNWDRIVLLIVDKTVTDGNRQVWKCRVLTIEPEILESHSANEKGPKAAGSPPLASTLKVEYAASNPGRMRGLVPLNLLRPGTS